MISFRLMSSDSMTGMYRKCGHKCRICGQWFNKGDSFGHIVIQGLKYNDEYVTDILDAKTGLEHENAFVHETCWNAIVGDNFHERVINVYCVKQPKVNGKRLDLIDVNKVNEFKSKINKEFMTTKETRESIYFKRGKIKLKYCKLTNKYSILNKMSGLSSLVIDNMIHNLIN
jgi:hypothetical protein